MEMANANGQAQANGINNNKSRYMDQYDDSYVPADMHRFVGWEKDMCFLEKASIRLASVCKEVVTKTYVII